MKKIILGLSLITLSFASIADPDKHGCGWGNMLFEGKSGLPVYVVASITNMTLSNAVFGMTSGTNGCQVHHPLPYGGQSWFAAADFSDQVVEDVAKGEGEGLDALAVMIGVEQEDRAYFNDVLHANFSRIAPNAEVSGEQVMQSIAEVLSEDARLAKYLA